MRILHTADWHLGKIVNNVYMTDDQAYILDQFIDIVKDTQPDAVVIAGDLYDRSIPPKQAVDLLNKTLTKLINDLQIPVLAISGNHDSPDRLEFGAQLFRKQGFYLDTKLSSNYEPVTFEDEYGPVHFHLIPYVEPAEVAYMLKDDSIKSHQQAAERLIDFIMEKYDRNERHIWVGHAFIAGGMESESEERLSMIGGSPYVDASLFEDFSYVALGHLHQAQRIKREAVRYSGSILKYSFSEVNHNKSVTLVELKDRDGFTFEQIPLLPKRDFEVVEGYFDDLMSGGSAKSDENYLHIRLLDDGQILDPMGKLRKVYPNILHLERASFTASNQKEKVQQLQSRQKLSPLELFSAFYEDIKGDELPEQRKQLIQTAIEDVRAAERGK
ncbi:exonuclease SbcCD subunit D [Halobacillus sp. A1]|uniref:exonuclease SbcCD subunit D n=1 Tax=Halobacillus sp. A1 TaxID=2880262 RepID=UPI0020A6612C|nr:exonuclease SbcCD subunit D [Halobacillus sp. A1]MCP3030755.1 exonuclease SbcCD subunit D [Halobacillus sp. A1]